MTGKSHLVLWEPNTIRLIHEVNKLRSSGIECWYSIDTGPSVFINTFQRHINAVASRLVELGFSDVIISGVGNTPKLTERHLF
jgi:mevalonate pyrophosphate decarboxylase